MQVKADAQSTWSSIVQVSALILARGCSKSIVKKNVKNFLDIPLVCHTVKVAVECNGEYFTFTCRISEEGNHDHQ